MKFSVISFQLSVGARLAIRTTVARPSFGTRRHGELRTEN
jgi:hypothetical protein